jgi:exonuclease III
MPMAPGRPARVDYEYVRRGTTNIYEIFEPKSGRHVTHSRKAPRFVDALRKIAGDHPKARRIHLIMGDLNIHCEKSVAGAIGAKRARRLWSRFAPHYTPKHASWLNPAEIELSLWSRECLDHDRIGSFEQLKARTTAWNAEANRCRRVINWHFTTQKARWVVRYRRRTTNEAKH